MACILDTLKQPPQQTKLIPYLFKDKTSFRLEEKHFPCCFGTALSLDDHDKNKQSFKLCKLKERLFDLNTLCTYQTKIWNHIRLSQLEDDTLKKYWYWLIHYKYKRIFKGYFTIKKESLDRPSYLWTLAYISIWRLGIKAFVYTVGKSNILDFIKYCKKRKNNEKNAPIIFIEVEEKIWDRNYVEQIIYIINWCESAVWPLWISIYLKQNTHTQTLNSNLQKFYQRIDQKKNKDFLQYFPQDILSKLSSLCIQWK